MRLERRRMIVVLFLLLQCLLVTAANGGGALLRGTTRHKARKLQAAELLEPYAVPLTLALYVVSNDTATALEQNEPGNEMVYHFCQAVHEQAGGTQVRKSATEVGLAVETNYVVIDDSLIDTQCTILATHRVLDTSPTLPGVEYYKMEIYLEQVVFAGWMNSSDAVLLLETLEPLVQNGFNRGRGGRVGFRNLLQENSAFASVHDVEVIDGLDTPAPSAIPSATPSVSLAPSVAPSIQETSHNPSFLPSVVPTTEATDSPSTVPSLVPSLEPSEQIASVAPSSFTSGPPSNSPLRHNVGDDTGAPSMVPSQSPVATSTSNALSPATIVGIICGLVAALMACFLIGFLCRRRPRKEDDDDDEEQGQSRGGYLIPGTPSRGSRQGSNSHGSTPRRGNLAATTPVPDILHLDNDSESLADTTLGEHTAGRKPPRRNRPSSPNSFDDGSVYTSPLAVVPPPRSNRKSVVGDDLGVCLEAVEDEKYASESVSSGGSSTEKRDSTASSVCSSASSSSSSSSSEEEEVESSQGSSSNEEEFNFKSERNFGGAIQDTQTTLMCDTQSISSPLGAERQESGTLNARNDSFVTPTKGVRGDSQRPSNVNHSSPQKPRRSYSPPLPGRVVRNLTPPRHTAAPVSEDSSEDPMIAASSSDFGSSEAMSFLSSDTSKQRGGRRPTGAFPSNAAASVSSESSNTSDGSPTPWLYNAVEGTLGPRSMSADMESLSGRSCKSTKSQRSRRSIKSQPAQTRRRRVSGDGKHHLDSTRSETSQTSRRLSSELHRLESHLAQFHLAGDGCSVSNASPSVANDSTTRASARSKDKQRVIVVVPPGKLGVILANRSDGRGTVVSHIRPTSPLYGKLNPGDTLVAVDDINVTSMDVSQITSIMSNKSDMSRRLTMITSAKVRSNADTPQTEAASVSESDVSSG